MDTKSDLAERKVVTSYEGGEPVDRGYTKAEAESITRDMRARSAKHDRADREVASAAARATAMKMLPVTAPRSTGRSPRPRSATRRVASRARAPDDEGELEPPQGRYQLICVACGESSEALD